MICWQYVYMNEIDYLYPLDFLKLMYQQTQNIEEKLSVLKHLIDHGAYDYPIYKTWYSTIDDYLFREVYRP